MISEVKVKVLEDKFNKLAQGDYRHAYGTGGFLDLRLSSTEFHCKTEDGQCEFIYRDDGIDEMTLIVVRGDVDRIKQLFKAEIDHFDSNVVWA